MLITFSGLDGAGKTTQIKLLSEYLKKNNCRIKQLRMYEDVSFSALIRNLLKMKIKNSNIRVGDSVYRYDKNKKDFSTVFLRKIAYIFDLLIFSFKRFYYQKMKNMILIMDRYLYDSLTNLFHTTSQRYIKNMLKIIPKPHLAILLDVEPKEAFSRKPEYPPQFYEERRQAYLEIFKDVPTRFVIHSDGILSTHYEIKTLFERSKKILRIRSDEFSSEVDFIMETLFRGPKEVDKIESFERFLSVLKKNRITVRWITKNYACFNSPFKDKFESILNQEKKRLKKAIEIIGKVTEEFEGNGLSIMVIKTLDNYPDLGHDIDFYTNAPVEEIDHIFIDKFKAKLISPTLSDKIARKRNYKIGDYPTLEIHCSRLGQVGEENNLAKDLVLNREEITIDGVTTYVPKIEFRILLTVLQRMYRHFNIRICDIYNTLTFAKNENIDWDWLKKLSLKYGVWNGVKLYMNYVQKVAEYYDIELSTIKKVFKNNNWPRYIEDRNMLFRFPLISTGVYLYFTKVVANFRRLNFYNVVRTSLVIPLSLAHYFYVKLIGKSRVW